MAVGISSYMDYLFTTFPHFSIALLSSQFLGGLYINYISFLSEV